MLKTRTWVIVIALAAALLALWAYRSAATRGTGQVVQIVQDGTVLREIDLSRVTEEYRFTVEWPGGGHNTILVQPGRICVSEADCPDKICVNRGWLAEGSLPIVCAPHRLVVTFKDASGAKVDAAAQ